MPGQNLDITNELLDAIGLTDKPVKALSIELSGVEEAAIVRVTYTPSDVEMGNIVEVIKRHALCIGGELKDEAYPEADDVRSIKGGCRVCGGNRSIGQDQRFYIFIDTMEDEYGVSDVIEAEVCEMCYRESEPRNVPKVSTEPIVPDEEFLRVRKIDVETVRRLFRCDLCSLCEAPSKDEASESSIAETIEDIERRLSRPVYIVAGNYHEYLAYARANLLRNHIDVEYASMPEILHGLAMGSIVVLTGSYAARRDWREMKQTLDVCRVREECHTLDGDPSW